MLIRDCNRQRHFRLLRDDRMLFPGQVVHKNEEKYTRQTESEDGIDAFGLSRHRVPDILGSRRKWSSRTDFIQCAATCRAKLCVWFSDRAALGTCTFGSHKSIYEQSISSPKKKSRPNCLGRLS